jgi:hypothetical protein
VGSADIQSLADLIGSCDTIKEMLPVPFTLRAVALLGIVALVPIAPLVLTMVSLPELMKRIMGVVF